MPIYAYTCRACGHSSEEFQKMTCQRLVQCPACSQSRYERVPTLPHTDLKEFHKPIEMLSIAMEDPDEIKEFVKKTGIEVSIDPKHPNYGVPIARNRSEKRKALAAAGFEERK